MRIRDDDEEYAQRNNSKSHSKFQILAEFLKTINNTLKNIKIGFSE